MTVRFDWIMDPCDRYLIWDKVEGLPTAYGKDMLIFDTIEEAAGVAALLNEHGNALCKCRVPANGEFIGLPSPNLTLKSQGKFRRKCRAQKVGDIQRLLRHLTTASSLSAG